MLGQVISSLGVLRLAISEELDISRIHMVILILRI